MSEDNNKKIKEEVKERTLGYVVAAFGVVAGLAWNDAVAALIDQLFPSSQNTIIAKFSYAIIITVVVVLITVYLARVFNRD